MKQKYCILMLSSLCKKFSRWHFEMFYFFQKKGIGISCRLSALETICMKYQILFSTKNKKNIINLLPVEYAQRVVKVKSLYSYTAF